MNTSDTKKARSNAAASATPPIELAMTYHAIDRTPDGVTIGDHVNSIDTNALEPTDNAARTGMLWVQTGPLPLPIKPLTRDKVPAWGSSLMLRAGPSATDVRSTAIRRRGMVIGRFVTYSHRDCSTEAGDQR